MMTVRILEFILVASIMVIQDKGWLALIICSLVFWIYLLLSLSKDGLKRCTLSEDQLILWVMTFFFF